MSDENELEIPLLLDVPPRDAVELAATGKLLDTLTELVKVGKAAQDIVTAGKTFRLKLPPALAAQVASGKLSMMQAASGGIRSAIVNQKGTIVSGSFHAVAAAPLVAVALWQLAAKITANHFLAEIDAKLASIDAKLDDVVQLISDEWKGALQGSMRKLASISRELRACELSDAELDAHRSVIEEIDLSARKIAVQAELRSKRLFERVRQLEPRVTPLSARLGKKADQMGTVLREIDEALAQEYFALYVRTFAVQVRSAVGANTATTRTRLAEIDDERTNADQRNREMLQLACERIYDVKGLLTRGATDDKHRQQLLDRRWSIVERARALDDMVAQAAHGVRRRIDASQAHDVWLKLDESGHVANAYVAHEPQR